MLAKQLFEDSRYYEWFTEVYLSHGVVFEEELKDIKVFKWYDCRINELRGLPSGFRVDLFSPSNDLIPARIQHINGSVNFTCANGLLQLGDINQWKLRLGISESALYRFPNITSSQAPIKKAG